MFEGMAPTDLEYGRVLQIAYSMIEADQRLPIGEALRRAIEVADVAVPGDVRDKMAVVLARVMLGGFPSTVEA